RGGRREQPALLVQPVEFGRIVAELVLGLAHGTPLSGSSLVAGQYGPDPAALPDLYHYRPDRKRRLNRDKSHRGPCALVLPGRFVRMQLAIPGPGRCGAGGAQRGRVMSSRHESQHAETARRIPLAAILLSLLLFAITAASM